MHRPIDIVVESIDGLGKTTLVNKLQTLVDKYKQPSIPIKNGVEEYRAKSKLVKDLPLTERTAALIKLNEHLFTNIVCNDEEHTVNVFDRGFITSDVYANDPYYIEKYTDYLLSYRSKVFLYLYPSSLEEYEKIYNSRVKSRKNVDGYEKVGYEGLYDLCKKYDSCLDFINKLQIHDNRVIKVAVNHDDELMDKKEIKDLIKQIESLKGETNEN